MHLYFAYGSNMDAAQMKSRCPQSELLGPAVLENHRLAFTIYSPARACGCADIVPSAGGRVHGLAYRLTDEDVARMDRFEGHPVHYRRIPVEIIRDGTSAPAITYEVVHKAAHVPTSKAYLDLLRTAAALHRFPESYQAFLASFERDYLSS